MTDVEVSLPSGTVTFLFTDIEGSTRLWEEHPADMRVAVERHDQIIRQAVTAHGGHVFATAGDSFAASFTRPGSALDAAVAAQRSLATEEWPATATVRVRMGVHTGVAQERDGDYFGSSVNRAARLMAVGHGGQVLVSGATAALVVDSLGDAMGGSIELAELGTFRLKDVRAPERIFEVDATGLAGGFPTVRAERRVNLPSRRAGFVGRAADTEGLAALLDPGAVVTVTGPGGVGKTRLALEAAGRVIGRYPDGVWFCDLAAVTDASALPRAVASALDIPAQERAGPIESIVRTLRDDRALVVLDNCEHVVGEAAVLARALRDGCPRVTVLATSRERLGLEAEVVRPLAPLAHLSDAVELFELRAREHDGGYVVGWDAASVEELCRHLDGIPLAIELAAARARALGPAEMLARIQDRFRLLRDDRRDRVARQRTLQATVDWSYRLLDGRAQLVFDVLAVFAGSFDLDAAVAMADGPGVDELDTIDVLTELVDRCLLTVERSGDGTRYRMLETLRAYGEQVLEGRGVLDEARRRHARYFADLAQRARQAYEGAECLAGVQAFELNWDNIRAAALWSLHHDDPQLRRDLIAGSQRFACCAQNVEVGDWVRLALPLATGADVTYYLGLGAAFSVLESDYPGALRHVDAMLAVARPLTAPETVEGHNAHGVALWHGGQVGLTIESLDRLEASARAADSPFDVCLAVGGRVVPAASLAPDEAPGHAREARRIAAEVDSLALHAVTHLYSAAAEQAVGHDEAAARYWERALEEATRCRDRSAESQILAWRSVRAPEAVRDRTYRDTLRRLVATRHWVSTWICLESLAAHWPAEHPDLAAKILGYLEHHHIENVGLRPRRQRLERLVAQHPDSEAWRAEGGRLERGELLSMVLDQLDVDVAEESSHSRPR